MAAVAAGGAVLAADIVATATCIADVIAPVAVSERAAIDGGEAAVAATRATTAACLVPAVVCEPALAANEVQLQIA